MTHRYLLSPSIFNVVVDAVFQKWVLVVVEAEGEAGPEDFGGYFHRLVA